MTENELIDVADYFGVEVEEVTDRMLWKWEELLEGDEADRWLDDPRNNWREL